MQKIGEVKNGKLEKIYVQKYYKNWLPAAAKKSAGDKSALGGKVSSTYTKGGNNIFGSGGSVSSSKSNKNSFDSLLKNSGSRSVASEIEKTILPQSIQLFDAISKRYAKITEDKRIDVDLTSED